MIKATSSDKELIVNILTDSFSQNQSVNYIIKQDKKRVERIRALMDYSFEMCFLFGDIYLSDDKKGCALILNPDKKKTTLQSIYLDSKLVIKCLGFKNLFKAMRREAIYINSIQTNQYIIYGLLVLALNIKARALAAIYYKM
jgi:hypothetical protein